MNCHRGHCVGSLWNVAQNIECKIQRHACMNDYKNNALKIVAHWKLGEVQMLKQEPMIAASTIDVPGRTMVVRSRVIEGSNLKEKGSTPEIVRVVIAAVKAVAQERDEEVNLDTNIVLDLGLILWNVCRLPILLSSNSADVSQKMFCKTSIQFAKFRRRSKSCSGLSEFTVALLRLWPPEEVLHSREVTREDYQFDLLPEYRRLKMTMSELLSTGVRNPYFAAHQGVVRDTTTIAGRELISFASYNYLGMSGDPL